MLRSISDIAADIQKDWGSKVHFSARPYLDAMLSLDSITDSYGADSATSIVLYFLSNARKYKGSKAKELKAELKALLKESEDFDPRADPMTEMRVLSGILPNKLHWSLPNSFGKNAATFAFGDEVEVTEGRLQGVRGTVEEVRDGMVEVRFNDFRKISGVLPVAPSRLKKLS